MPITTLTQLETDILEVQENYKLKDEKQICIAYINEHYKLKVVKIPLLIKAGDTYALYRFDEKAFIIGIQVYSETVFPQMLKHSFTELEQIFLAKSSLWNVVPVIDLNLITSQYFRKEGSLFGLLFTVS